jgi:hypothetical protein
LQVAGKKVIDMHIKADKIAISRNETLYIIEDKRFKMRICDKKIPNVIIQPTTNNCNQ